MESARMPGNDIPRKVLGITKCSAPGFKYNLTDIAAAIGVEQLKKCDRFWKRDDASPPYTTKLLRTCRRSRGPCAASDVQHAWHLYAIQLNLERLRIDRSEFIEALKEKNIGTSVHFIPSAYASLLPRQFRTMRRRSSRMRSAALPTHHLPSDLP